MACPLIGQDRFATQRDIKLRWPVPPHRRILDKRDIKPLGQPDKTPIVGTELRPAGFGASRQIVQGLHTPARPLPRFEQEDGHTGIGQLQGGGEAGQPGAQNQNIAGFV